jgi:predicted MFS family arabinose efflux permease
LIRLRIFLLFSFGYFVSYVLRGVNVGFAPFLTAEMHLSAIDLGTLTSLYFLGFAAAQIPGGLLVDRYGPRRVNAGLIVLGSLGVLIFGLAPNFGVMMAGRLLIGIGVSAALGSAFTALSQHFELRQLPMLNGLVMAIGGLGGVMVGTPLSWLLTLASWREISLGISAFSVLVALSLWLGAVDASVPRHSTHFVDQVKDMRRILGSSVFWKTASFSAMTQGVFYGMQSLWAASFMRDFSGFDAGHTAALVSVIGVAMMAGNVGLGLLARRMELGAQGLHVFCGIAMAIFLIDQILILLRVPLPAVLLWAIYGALGGSGILSYAALARHFPPQLIGRLNASFNMVIFLLIFGVQIGVGAVLSLWPASAGQYPAAAHMTAWVVLVALQAAGAVWYFWPSGTRGR